MMDEQKPVQLESDFGGGIAPQDGQDGGYTNLGRTDIKLESMDAQREQERTKSYKVIRTGQDEIDWWTEEDVKQPTERA